VKDDVESNGVNEWPDACGKSCARKVAPGQFSFAFTQLKLSDLMALLVLCIALV
jgi:hypothetical protein